MFCLVLNQNSSGIQPADRKCTQPLLLSVLELDEKKPADSFCLFPPVHFFVLLLIYNQISLILQSHIGVIFIQMNSPLDFSGTGCINKSFSHEQDI